MEPRRIVVILVAVLLGSLAGALAGVAATRVGALLLPGEVEHGARLTILTLMGYVAWATAALAVSAAWLRWQGRSR